MTATLIDPIPPAPGVGERSFSLDTCRRSGVVLDPEQEILLIQAASDRALVMCAVPLPDPLHQHRAAGLRPPRLKVHESPRDAGHPVVVPMAGQVDWSATGYSVAVSLYGPHWYRFPSVPVELFDPLQPGKRPFWPDMVRVWNTWPIDPSQFAAVTRSSEGVMAAFAELIDIGDDAHCLRDPCEIVYGQRHEHVPHPVDPGREVCVTGERMIEQLRAERLWLDYDKAREFEESLEIHSDIAQAWERLVASSRRNTAASLGVVPPWERSELIYLEEEFTPWL